MATSLPAPACGVETSGDTVSGRRLPSVAAVEPIGVADGVRWQRVRTEPSPLNAERLAPEAGECTGWRWRRCQTVIQALLSRPTKPLKQQENASRWVYSLWFICSTCTFGAACELGPNICDQPPMRSCVASIVPVTLSTAICSGLPVLRAPAHPLSHGHQITRDGLRRIGPGSGRAGDGSTQGSRPFRRRGVEQAHARLSGPAQPSPTLGDAINAGYGYLEVSAWAAPCVVLGHTQLLMAHLN